MKELKRYQINNNEVDKIILILEEKDMLEAEKNIVTDRSVMQADF